VISSSTFNRSICALFQKNVVTKSYEIRLITYVNIQIIILLMMLLISSITMHLCKKKQKMFIFVVT